MTDIYKEIINDHERHRSLLDRIANSQGEIEDRKKLWEEFYYDVKSHAAAEEESFYARVMEEPKGQDDARHSVAEHKELDDIMEELNAMDMNSSGWLNRFSTLKHDYEHHMAEEEEDIFAKARDLFSDEEAKEFASVFRVRKSAERDLVDAKAEESLEE